MCAYAFVMHAVYISSTLHKCITLYWQRTSTFTVHLPFWMWFFMKSGRKKFANGTSAVMYPSSSAKCKCCKSKPFLPAGYVTSTWTDKRRHQARFMFITIMCLTQIRSLQSNWTGALWQADCILQDFVYLVGFQKLTAHVEQEGEQP